MRILLFWVLSGAESRYILEEDRASIHDVALPKYRGKDNTTHTGRLELLQTKANHI